MKYLIKPIKVAIIGGAADTFENDKKDKIFSECYEIGELLAKENSIVLTGGNNGVGEFVMSGAFDSGGITIAFLPGYSIDNNVEKITIPIYTGLGEGFRDLLMLRSSDVVIGVGGGAGTLNELANAYNLKKPIVILKGSGGWSEYFAGKYLDKRKKIKVLEAKNARDAVEISLKIARRIKKIINLSHQYQ